MGKLTLLLWDVGGVLLSNGWDHRARAAAARHFQLDAADLERRHGLVDAAFETDQLDWDGYLDATVFYAPRTFSREEFGQFVREQSTANPAAIAAAWSLRRAGAYAMATLNNESRALNEYRLWKFELRGLFHAFFSSCYTGRRKPELDAYRFALEVTQCAPEECLFLDDRPENIAAAAQLGLRTLQVHDPERLTEELASAGVAAG
jgi:putative hydrolase of the HAD superfamily